MDRGRGSYLFWDDLSAQVLPLISMRRFVLPSVTLLSVAALLAQAGYGNAAPASAVPGSVAQPSAPVPTAAGGNAPAVAKIAFNDHIQPILAENCFSCHGPDSSTRKGKLRLDRFEYATVTRGDHEPAIVPGKADVSPLIERILSNDDEERMPPLESHKTLKPAEIALLKRWVAEGAE